ncbi:FAD-binding and (Fe-S)-binding domain-containing protein [Actinomadura harenae]|uniref:FAD-binding oxidoreductase n=1 Tax=Actinomadura harenae TaxID=2483351 RepID=A0A3M2MD73_9ACTN|nr:FAD-binding and (Fe-S)-binding domain-containing protein [Actinomadura harenae]RMI47461.1 FAD-binding oxidoreductase [Actinomadura harenae]
MLGSLTGELSGIVRTDLTTRTAYSSDASLYRRVPVAVAEPRSVEDLERVRRVAAEAGVPVTVRGGGTSVAGNAIGDGLVVDVSRHLNAIRAIDPEARTAVVEPGVVLDDLRAAAAGHGLTFGPDPSTHSRCTLGGMIGNNACGSHSVAYGTTADAVVELRLLLPDGRHVTARHGGVDDLRLERGLRALRDAFLGPLRTELGRFARQGSGYGLHHLLPENGFDVAKALVGAEGTCGIVTEATVRLVEPPKARALAVLGFADVFEAAEAAPAIAASGTALTVEGMASDLLAALRARPGRHDAGSDLPPGGGWLYCEVGGESPGEAREAAHALARATAARSVVVDDPRRMRELWWIREAGAGIVTRLPDGGEAWPGWEDSAVPPDRLAAYLRDLYALMRTHGLRGVPFGHFGEGCLHVRLDFPLATRPGVYRAFAEDAAGLVVAHGGSVSGEHGDGRARSELLDRMYPPELRVAFAAFKRLFDPHRAFNPGVITDPEPLDERLRPGPGADRLAITPVHALARDGGSFAAAVQRCVGVGACRTVEGGTSMCPSFKVTRDEVHSTRGRARVLAELLRGESLRDGWRSAEARDALDLCLSCKACASDCPVNVDMATYKAEFLHRHYAWRVRPMTHYSMGWLPLWSRLATVAPGIADAANAVLREPRIATALKRAAGIDTRRDLPSFARRPLRRAGLPARTAGRPVVLWPDTFTAFHTPGIGRAAVSVLAATGHRAVLPPRAVCCGLTWHSTGQLGVAKRVLRRTLDVLGPALDAGLPVVGLEPSCTVMLRDEAPELLPDDPRAHRLAASVVTLAELVADAGPWPFGTVDQDAVAQVHCHQEAKGSYAPDLRVLERLGVRTDVVGAGCCGLAGDFGFARGHWDVSQGCAERELYPKAREAPLVLADGFSCRVQIVQGTGRRAVHLAELLADALEPSP